MKPMITVRASAACLTLFLAVLLSLATSASCRNQQSRAEAVDVAIAEQLLPWSADVSSAASSGSAPGSRRHTTTPLESDGRIHAEGEGLMQRGFGLKPKSRTQSSQSIVSMVLFALFLMLGMHGAYAHGASFGDDAFEHGGQAEEEDLQWGSTLGLQRFFKVHRAVVSPSSVAAPTDDTLASTAQAAADEDVSDMEPAPAKLVRIPMQGASLLGLQRRTVVQRASSTEARLDKGADDSGHAASAGFAKKKSTARSTSSELEEKEEAEEEEETVPVPIHRGSVVGLQRSTSLRRGVLTLVEEEEGDGAGLKTPATQEPTTHKATSLLGLQRATTMKTVVLPADEEE